VESTLADTIRDVGVVPRAELEAVCAAVLTADEFAGAIAVISSHHTPEAARKAAQAASGGTFRAVARAAHKSKGDTWLRVYEESSPEV